MAGELPAGTGIGGLTFNYTVSQHDARVELYIDRGKDKDAENGTDVRSHLRCVQTPLVQNALQRVEAAVREPQARAGHQVPHRARDQGLVRTREATYPGPDVNGDPAHLVAKHLTLASVDTDPNLDAQGVDALDRCASAANGACGAVERGKHPVASDVDFPPSKSI